MSTATDPLLAARPKAPPAPPGVKKKTAVAQQPEPPDLEVYAEEGDIVDWFAGPGLGEPPQIGVVTQIQIDTKVAVNVLSPYLGYTVPQDGAYHAGHRNATADAGAGCWRHRPITVAVRRLLLAAGILVWNDRHDRLVVAPGLDAAGVVREFKGGPPPEKP